MFLLFGVLFGVSIAGHKYNNAFLVWDWCLADVGQTYISALHLLEGQIPYRDFDYQWGPYALYLSAYILKVLGVQLSSMRFAMTLVVIVITSLTYFLAREFLPRFHAFFSALIIHMIFIQNTLIPYANIFVIPVGLTALLLIVKYGGRQRGYFILLAGILCGIALGLKFNAGLLVCAGIVMALIVVEGRSERLDAKSLSLSFSLRVLIPIVFILGLSGLIFQHLSVKYLVLFMLPVVIASVAALRQQGRLVPEATEGKRRLTNSLLYLVSGGLLGSVPWIGFYLLKLEPGRFFHYLVFDTLKYSRYIFHPYYEMDRFTFYFYIFSALWFLAVYYAGRTSWKKHAWLLTLVGAGGYLWLFRDWTPLTRAASDDPFAGSAVDNITYFLTPLASIVAGLLLLSDSRKKVSDAGRIAESTGMLVILLYHVFFFFVAYPHTEASHLSWSYPTGMVVIFYLLEKARRTVAGVWPEKMRTWLGKPLAAGLAFFFPVLITVNHFFHLSNCYYELSPDLSRWTKRVSLKLDNERAGIYEFVCSAYQIESVDRFIQAWTDKDEYIFEFPTAFFYFYSQRKNPSKVDYFYPGLYSDRQGEVISALEKTRPRFAIIYDRPESYIFAYSNEEIRSSYQDLIDYLEAHYRKVLAVGSFTILEKMQQSSEYKATDGEGKFRLEELQSVPVYGDWNGDGVDEIGVFRSGTWLLDVNRNGRWDGPMAEKWVVFGREGDIPVVGDWNGDGVDELGIFRKGVWVLDLNGNGKWDGQLSKEAFFFGYKEGVPVVGDWNANGIDEVGVFSEGVWIFDLNGNHEWDGLQFEKGFFFET
ncbi:MAG: hypothetical protein Kow0099_05430 [Candidatus Abyssubacteria bacterium]